MVDVRLPAASAISLMPSRACFLVPTNSTVPPRWAMSAANALRLREQRLGLEQVDDVDAAALAVDEAAHLRVPAARLVAEVHAGLQQLSDSYLSHGGAPFCRFGTAARAIEAHGTRRGRRAGPAARVASVPPPGVRGIGCLQSSPAAVRTSSAMHLRCSLQRTGPPFPYLRWDGSPSWPVGRPLGVALSRVKQALLERRVEVVGQLGGRASISTPVTGCANASRPACRNWRASPSPARRTRGRRAPGGRSPSGARGSGACGRSPAARAAASRAAGALDLEVRDRVARVVGVGGHARPHAPVAPERRVDRAAARAAGGPRRARGTRASISRARSVACSAAWTASRAREHEQPGGVAVEPVHDARAARRRRRRRRGPRAPARACRGGARAPGARRRRPACRPPAGARPRRRSRTVASGTSGSGASGSSPHLDPLAGRDGVALLARGGRRRAPARASISRCAAAREPVARARKTSSRSPACSGPTRQLHGSAAPRGRTAGSARRT